MVKNVIFKSPILILFLLSLLIIWPTLMPGYFSHHDDLQVMRIFEMRKCFQDLQIPCRWVPDMGYGNGFPLFNFYSPLPYYIGAIFSYILGYVEAAKLLFFIPLTLAGISMYLLLKELFGKNAALLGGILYLFAPYRALDSYVRGDVAESFAISVIPLVFYFFHRLIKGASLKNVIFSSVFLGIFLLCHNIMILFFIPILLIWNLFFLWVENFNNILKVLSAWLLGFGLAAFFLIPAFLEKNLVTVETLTRMDLDFRVHFVTLAQLFLKRDWGYGASVYGPNDTLSFQIGWPHWWIVAIVLAVYLFFLMSWNKLGFFRKINLLVNAESLKSKNNFLLFVIFLLIFVVSVFMMHNQSAFIWEKIDLLHFAQFPWRFLAISIFSVSLISALGLQLFKKSLQMPILAATSLLAILLNWSFFKPDKFYYSVDDQNKLSGQVFLMQQKAGIQDYLPKTALEPNEVAPNGPLLSDPRNAEVVNFINRSNKWSFNLSASKIVDVEVPVFDFANWEVSINGKKVEHSLSKVGRIQINLGPGSYFIEGSFKDTPIRTLSNIISLLSALVVVCLIFYGKAFKKR